MKKICALFFVVVLAACDSTSSSSSNDYEVFWAIDMRTNTYYQLEAQLVGEGDNSIVYLEKGQSVSQETVDEIIFEFDGPIWNTVTINFAEPSDIDENGKVILLLLDIRDYFGDESDSYVAGYFYEIDLLTQEELTAIGWGAEKSNEAEILYIDIHPNDPTTKDFRSTIAHEFQHLVNYAQNVIIEEGTQMPLWIDEGFSMAAEAIYQDVFILPSRETWYNEDPLFTGRWGIEEDREKSIAHGYPLSLWDPFQDTTAVLNDYALSHLFFAWLRIHMHDADHDDTFFRRIMEDEDNTFEAVLTVCGDLGDDDEVKTASDMIQRFYMANLLGAKVYDNDGTVANEGNTEGLESYLGKNDHSGPFMYEVTDDKSVKLYPSGTVNVDLNEDDWSPISGDDEIVYALGDRSSLSAEYTPPFSASGSRKVLMVTNSVISTNENDIKTSAPLPASSFQTRNSSVIQKEPSRRRITVDDVMPPQEVFRIGPETIRAEGRPARQTDR